jgi:hypothetical protein
MPQRAGTMLESDGSDESLNVDALMKAMVRRFVSMAVVVLLIVGAMTAAGKTLRRDPALSLTPGSGRTFRDLPADGQPCVACPELVDWRGSRARSGVSLTAVRSMGTLLAIGTRLWTRGFPTFRTGA